MKQLIALAVLFLTTTATWASEGSISVTPAVVTLRGGFGQSTTQKLTITNGTDRELTFAMVGMDVTVRNGKREFVRAGEMVGSIAATAVFSQPEVRVPAGQSSSVDVTMTIPPEAEHRAVVMIFQGKSQLMSGRVGVMASIGTLMTIRVTDNVEIDVVSPVITPQTASENVRVLQTCVNSGTEPVIVKGAAAILDRTGALVGRVDLQPTRLLPGESGNISAEHAGELAQGHYQIMVTVSADDETKTSTAELDVK